MTEEYVTIERDGLHYPLWIGFDLDGTLAEEHGWGGPDEIGPPISSSNGIWSIWDSFRFLITKSRIKNTKGLYPFKVKIFTARACRPDHVKYIRAWMDAANIPDFVEITNEKSYGCRMIFDDNAIPVDKNSGLITERTYIMNINTKLEKLWKQQ